MYEKKSVIKIFYDNDWGWKLVPELSSLVLLYNRAIWACQEQAEIWEYPKVDMFTNHVLKEIGVEYQKSVAQVILRWLMQRNIVALAKSTHIERKF